LSEPAAAPGNCLIVTAAPQTGQNASPASALAVTIIVSPTRVTLSATSPLGTKERLPKLRRIALILQRKQRKLATKLHRM
jgi:hypothetical protein